MRIYIRKTAFPFLILFLALFMSLIFGPTEIFFGNYTELGFVFHEFGWTFLILGFMIALLGAVILAFFPDIIKRNILAFVLGCSVAAYIQSMFLNRGLESIGQTAEGYIPQTNQVIKSCALWLICIILFLILGNMQKAGKKILAYIAGSLLAIQVIAYISLFITADQSAFSYPESELCLDASEQYVVSSKENILVLVLDNFSNEWLYEARLNNPSFLSVMKDFTYYNNADCNQYGTYPSLVHLLTGNPINLEQTVNEYTYDCWNNERSVQYFNLLSDHDYKLNVYTPESDIITGANTLSVTEGKISNITNTADIRTINYRLMYKDLIKMSCYRYAPDFIKNLFYVSNSEYTCIVTSPNDMEYNNYDYYYNLVTTGLSTDDTSNYFVFQHLNGMHEFVNDEHCQPDFNVTNRDTCLNGVFYMLDEYFNQLRALNAYDNSTIIVLADHGSMQNGQPIFFIKRQNETHDAMLETTAPIDYDAFMPTIVQCLGEEHDDFGPSIYDYEDGQWRERIFVERKYNSDYPAVDRYNGIGNGADNVYHIYRYTGDMWYLISAYELFQFETQPMVDSFY